MANSDSNTPKTAMDLDSIKKYLEILGVSPIQLLGY